MNNAGSAAYAGAFFPQATGFNIRGGGFTSNITNNVYNPLPEQPSAFRTVLLGDINLIKEFKAMRSSPQSSLVGRRTPGASVRRVYTAKLEGRESGHMTVALYEGDGAENAWNQHLAKYEAIRHPNIMQLYGLLSTTRLRGMVFHDELIPYAQFLRRFEHSPILSTYIIAYCTTEFREAADYISCVFCVEPLIDYTVWVRPPTGELCLDLAPGAPGTSVGLARWWKIHVLRLENLSLETPDSENIVISSLREDQYHELCSGYPIAQSQYFQVSTEHPVGLGIFRWDSQYWTFTKITEPLQIFPEELHWYNSNYGRAPDELLPNSWIRYEFHRTHLLELKLEFSYEIQKAWLAQANHIFAELDEVTHAEDYGTSLTGCARSLFINRSTLATPVSPLARAIYSFVLPREFRTNTEPDANSYQWPACPAYWSLDPSGADRLSTEDAKSLGFPAIHIETSVVGKSWDHSVYEGLQRFHEGKGFDPEGREVARRLGCPLFEGLSNRVPFPARKFKHPWCQLKDAELCRELCHWL
ncbi:hypothetical protein MSAN_02275700 [Mycena sanguinolenta]|uniref:Protein kinase domain-containing protein n=1 Tax=Mycena sanguinolenta TaxID=230812 RepID=A0A8H6X9P7_9AGAR|nr:hypothetical protein MSAN_02275700 [Mycena sanguinolenta]